jgi:hypothetical protein
VNDINEPTHGYHQNCNTSEMVIFGGYVKVRESLYTRVIICVNTFLNHIDTKAILPQCEGQTLIPYWYKIKIKREILTIDNQMVPK